MQPLNFDEIARYSAWPSRLLDPNQQVRFKTEAEVKREYNRDKWGALLEYATRAPGVTLEMAEDHQVNPHTLAPYFESGNFYLASEQEALQRHVHLYAETLRPYLRGASCLVELGAGFGSKIMRMARLPSFAHLPLIAGEYTENGRSVISAIANTAGIDIRVGHCDFRTLDFDALRIPPKAIIFTSYSVHYVPELDRRFVGALSALDPRIIVNFEPVYEYHSAESIFGLMCRRYAELNDYTRNLGSLIDDAATASMIYVKVSKNILGSNPFLPISAIEWAPVGRAGA